MSRSVVRTATSTESESRPGSRCRKLALSVELRRLDRELAERQLVAPRIGQLGRLDALRLAHDRAELADDFERVALVGEPLEFGELQREPVGIDRRTAQPPDLRVRR